MVSIPDSLSLTSETKYSSYFHSLSSHCYSNSFCNLFVLFILVVSVFSDRLISWHLLPAKVLVFIAYSSTSTFVLHVLPLCKNHPARLSSTLDTDVPIKIALLLHSSHQVTSVINDLTSEYALHIKPLKCIQIYSAKYWFVKHIALYIGRLGTHYVLYSFLMFLHDEMLNYVLMEL